METLSKNELDALLSALNPVSKQDGSSGDPGSQSARPAGSASQLPPNQGNQGDNPRKGSGKDGSKVEHPYDFRRQTKFSREQLNTLHLIHETFVRLMGTDLSGRLRTNAQATLIGVEQRTFEEFMQTIYDPTFITVFRSDTLEGEVLIDVNLNIVFCFLDRLLGGSGIPLNTIRQLTEVEKQIMQKIMVGIIDKLREAWLSIVDLAPAIKLIESNPQFAQIASPTSICIAVTVELKIHDMTGTMNICIPYSTVSPITHKLRAASWFTAERNETPMTQVELLTEQVRDVYLPLVAELGSLTATLEEIVELKVGDIIETDQRIKDDIKIKVGDLIKFYGRPGIIGKKMGVEITGVTEPIDTSTVNEEDQL